MPVGEDKAATTGRLSVVDVMDKVLEDEEDEGDSADNKENKPPNLVSIKNLCTKAN